MLSSLKKNWKVATATTAGIVVFASSCLSILTAVNGPISGSTQERELIPLDGFSVVVLISKDKDVEVDQRFKVSIERKLKERFVYTPQIIWERDEPQRYAKMLGRIKSGDLEGPEILDSVK